MSKFTCLFVCVVAVSLNGVYALSEEEKAKFLEAIKPVLTECSESHGVSDADLKAAKESVNPEGINPCFIGCVLKKVGVLNAQGVYDVDEGLKKLYKHVSSEADRAKFEEIGKKCTTVNDQAVSDGEAGCDRAMLLVKCFLENKAELPL